MNVLAITVTVIITFLAGIALGAYWAGRMIAKGKIKNFHYTGQGENE